MDKIDFQLEKKSLFFGFSTEVTPQKDSYFHSVEKLWKSSIFYLEKDGKIDSLDYVMYDIRFLMGRIEAVGKDEISLTTAF